MPSSLAVFIPVHFPPQIDEETVRQNLTTTIAGQDRFVASENLLLSVDEGSIADQVLGAAPRDSELSGLRRVRLKKNLGKTGAVRRGLKTLLETSQASYFVTRDCDTDHDLLDLPRFIRMADELQRSAAGGKPFAVFGARTSLAKSMGWRRQEWERLTNDVLLDIVEFAVARRGEVIDRRFWNGYPLDLQSGYRLYNRSGAEAAAASLQRLPDDPSVYTFACEMAPFVELSLLGGRVGQIQTLSRVTQPFSSYAEVSLPECYGRLLAYISEQQGLSRAVLLQIFDNRLAESPLYFSAHRDDLLACRSLIDPQADPPQTSTFL